MLHIGISDNTRLRYHQHSDPVGSCPNHALSFPCPHLCALPRWWRVSSFSVVSGFPFCRISASPFWHQACLRPFPAFHVAVLALYRSGPARQLWVSPFSRCSNSIFRRNSGGILVKFLWASSFLVSFRWFLVTIPATFWKSVLRHRKPWIPFGDHPSKLERYREH